MKTPITIHWFRQDLRLSDNPSLYKASQNATVLPIYILDDTNAGHYKMGGASRWWLHHSLLQLNEDLGGHLSVYEGDAQNVFDELCARFNIQSVYWNRCYEPWRINRDKALKSHLKSKGIEVQTSNGALLWEPWTIKKTDDTPYKVFTPFYRKGCLNAPPPRQPLPEPERQNYCTDEEAMPLDALSLLPDRDWPKMLEPHWDIGERAAHKRFQAFLNEGLAFYKDGRNIPSKPYVSRLSPYLHFGEISPNQVWYQARALGDDQNIDHLCSELGWREFSFSQLYFNPDLPNTNLQRKFDAFPWDENQNHLHAWQRGQTGIPMVDAGMRELWQTGYMHNRVRMIVGSFLVKNLLLDWRLGERWFWDTLVDADLANNCASWQWIAGCGADAAPYFRIFNPVTQGQKFDPKAEYIRKFLPEIAPLPDKYIFSPWEAPQDILNAAQVNLGETYPLPIVDLKSSREAALAAFQSLKQTET